MNNLVNDTKSSVFSARRAETARLERVDRIVRFAVELFAVPIAVVSLIGAERQWFASRFGLLASETPRCVAFCDHAIRRSSILIVGDATRDACFKSDPLVSSAPNVRSYTGAPVTIVRGYRIGTLCIIDTAPRQDFGADESVILGELADAVIRELELRSDQLKLYERADQLDCTFDTFKRAAESKILAVHGHSIL
jgi:GAF domain-containing protein